MPVPDAFLDQLRQRLPLADLMREKVALEAIGDLLQGECPLHPDRSKGLRVASDGHFFQCFSCRRDGDLVRWTMETEKLTEPEALSSLARRAGLPPPVSI